MNTEHGTIPTTAAIDEARIKLETLRHEASESVCFNGPLSPATENSMFAVCQATDDYIFELVTNWETAEQHLWDNNFYRYAEHHGWSTTQLGHLSNWVTVELA